MTKTVNEWIAMEVKASYYEALFRYFNKDDRPPEERRIRSLDDAYVTTLASLCMRQQFFGRIMPTTFTTDSVIRMLVGTKLHEIRLYPEDSENYFHELRIEWEGISGRVDEFYNGLVIDKKTTRKPPKGPSAYVVNQLRYYVVILRELKYEVKGAVVLYFDVNSALVESYPVDISPDHKKIKTEMLQKKEVFQTAIRTMTPPARNMGWWCNRCERSIQCFSPNWKEKILPKDEVIKAIQTLLKQEEK